MTHFSFAVHILTLWTVQAVDEFVFELAYKENNAEKRQKITALRLNEGEWTCVRLFCNILQVSQLFDIFNLDTNPHSSMPTMPSAPSLLSQRRHSTTPCQRWKGFTRLGRRPPTSLAIPISHELSPREWTSSIPTTNVRLNLMRTSWQWVGYLILSVITQLKGALVLRRRHDLVLNPKKKMGHFSKHWPADLVLEVEEVVQQRVCYSSLYCLTYS